MYQYPTITVQTRDGATRERLPIPDMQASFKETWNVNDTWQIEFTVLDNADYRAAIGLLAVENIINYGGQQFYINSINREINNGTSTYSVTATHQYFTDSANLRINGSPDSGNSSDSNGTPTSFQDAVNKFLNGNDQGISAEFHGNFPIATIESPSGSFQSFFSSHAGDYNAVVIPNGKHWVFYTTDAFRHDNGRTMFYEHDSEDVKLGMDSSSIVNQAQCYGKANQNDNSNTTTYAVNFLWSNQGSINRWGLHRGDVIQDDRFTDQNSMQSYEDSHQQIDPSVTLTLNAFSDEGYQKGEVIHLVIPKYDWKTTVTLNHIERNPFNEKDVPTLAFDNTAISVNDVNAALRQQIKGIHEHIGSLIGVVSSGGTDIENHMADVNVTWSKGEVEDLNGKLKQLYG